MKIRVLHAYYGCDTGCCGHILEIDDEEVEGSFVFSHPDDLEVLRAYILKHVPKECHESIDWPSIELVGCAVDDYC
jgi:hypothetical protein